jgi:hypothetical protein
MIGKKQILISLLVGLVNCEKKARTGRSSAGRPSVALLPLSTGYDLDWQLCCKGKN